MLWETAVTPAEHAVMTAVTAAALSVKDVPGPVTAATEVVMGVDYRRYHI